MYNKVIITFLTFYCMCAHGFITIPPPTPPATIQYIINTIQTSPMLHFIQQNMDKIRHIPVEKKLNLMYVTYYIRQIYATIGISQQTMIHIMEEIEWTDLDYFNTFIFISSIYACFKNLEIKETMDKLTNNGVVSNQKIRRRRIILFVIFSILFRDLENAT